MRDSVTAGFYLAMAVFGMCCIAFVVWLAHVAGLW